MDERSISSPPTDVPIPGTHHEPGPGGSGALADPRALQILTTEHWSLLSARALVYNEAFARAGMFLALLSATLVALGLVATATGFSDGFLVVAAVVLALDLFVGLTSLGRIGAAGDEDIRCLQGMNRLRHAYLEMVPGLERYFITSGYDDFDSVMSVYGRAPLGPLGATVHGLTTTPGMLAVVCAAVAGALVAVVLLLLTHEGVVAGLGGLAAFVAFGAVSLIYGQRGIGTIINSLETTFPRPPRDDAPGR